jgi:hypothetical protein
MDDATYLTRLRAILTNPRPTGTDPADPYGMAGDRIDRSAGFGRDVWVESVDAVGGEHGAEVEVGFGLEPPVGREDEPDPLAGLSREARWQLLLTGLTDIGTVRDVAPGRITVEDHDGAVCTVLITPDQWDVVLRDHAAGDVPMYFCELYAPGADDETFLVFYRGDLHRSTRERLPPVRSTADLRAIERALAENPGAGIGWFAYPPSHDPREDPR